MCVLALAWEAHPRWRLVFAGNRDELHARPAAPLRRWEAPGDLLAGQDLLSGGTWLGVSERGRFAVVTNLRGHGPPEAGAPSRGLLLRDLLTGRGLYADPSDRELDAFNPLNLLVLRDDRLEAWGNRPAAERRVLPPGLYGLSNGALDEPWPKTVRLKAIVAEALAADAALAETLLDGLEEDVLPDAVLSHSDLRWPRSPIFIRDPRYGTRCSTVVAIDHAGHGLIVERRFAAGGEPDGETALSFAWLA